MKRRKGRRKARARSSPRALAPGLIALAVVIAAVVLIVRGDRTPRPRHTVAHRSHHATVAASAPAGAPAPFETPAPVAAASPASPVGATVPPTLAPGAPPTLAPAGASPAPSGAASPGENVPPTLAPAGASPAAQPSSAPSTGPSPNPSGAPRLALIIDDCGQWPVTERGFIALPVPLTLSVLPHVRYGDAIARDARAAGKGVMLHLPMEPRSGAYPGPGEVKVAMDDAAIAAQVRDDIASVPLASGVNNHEGSRATADDRVMRAVSAVIAEHRLFFVDSRTGADSVAARDAAAAGIATASRDVFLDDVAELNATEDELRRAAALAKRNGSAIAIGHPRPTTLAAVRALLPELRRDGIDFVLAGDLVH
jgi:polysaccharide deacetylase 2 family uncharacterized protein YibQ